MTENSGVIQCPDCGIENPANRVTCLVCHAALYSKSIPTEKSKDAPVPKEKKEPVEKKPKKEAVKKVNPLDQKIRPPIHNFHESSVIAATKDIPQIKRGIIKRKARRKSKAPTNEQYFKLQGDMLIPVEISIRMKALKKKQAKTEARILIDLWNRNKSLISK